MVKNSPANAGDMGLITGLRRSHMPVDQLNPCTTTTEPARLEPVLHKPVQWETHTPQLESSPHSLQLEESQHSNEDSAQPKINNNYIN